MGLKADVAKTLGSVFGKATEDTFLKYYEEDNPKELLKACREMMTKMLGPAATHRHCQEMVKKHPEIKKIVEELK